MLLVSIFVSSFEKFLAHVSYWVVAFTCGFVEFYKNYILYINHFAIVCIVNILNFKLTMLLFIINRHSQF